NRIFGKEYLHEGAEDHYQFCSAIPVGTLLAQTYDIKLMEEVGSIIGREMEELGVQVWLAPGMNIHRNPLCGRNFEYYSEDPLLSGKMAAAITRGVEGHPGCIVTIKHFACNNQEENRRGVSSIVSERALRELYLKGFEIAVKEAHPGAIMTSYNKLNGVHTANSYDLCTIAARREWGFTGIIMTDWTTTNSSGGSAAVKCITAGNDLIMPGNPSDMQEILDALEDKYDLSLPMEALDDCVRRMLSMTLRLTRKA
ncbi:MAG: glycoside hydrolase family 3 protein, partial [Firmicutes bacterium]|nr:glycoside hydrolase family 3 protein [Bacillota bacterium]